MRFGWLTSSRGLNSLMAGGCLLMMAVALFMEHGMGLPPCSLCILQRGAAIAVGLLALAAALHGPPALGVRLYGGLTGLAALTGAGLAARQLWLQSLPAEQVPACGPGLGYMLEVLPWTDALGRALAGDGGCAEVLWEFAGLSIPGWTLVGFLGLAALSAWQLLAPRT